MQGPHDEKAVPERGLIDLVLARVHSWRGITPSHKGATMPPQSRVGDNSNVPTDSHGCPACPHNCTGPIIAGSPDVFANGLPAARKADPGVHAACCDGNSYTIEDGSSTVFINGHNAARQGDPTTHCGGNGTIKAGSGDINTGG